MAMNADEVVLTTFGRVDVYWNVFDQLPFGKGRTHMLKKQAMFAAPFVAAVTFVCQPMLAEDKPTNQVANQADRAADTAGRSADRAGQAAGDATNAARAGANDAAAQLAGARQGNMDQKFATKISDMNNFEIQSGRLAQEKAQRDEIKQFAKTTIDDHTQAQQQLQQIAQKKNMQLSQQLMPVHQAMLDELSKLDGQEFERAYLYGQVAGHTKSALKLRDAKNELQDPELKQYAATILPKVQQHLQHSQRLANADEAITAGARIGGDRSGQDAAGQDRPGAGATDRLRPGTGDSATPGNTDGSRPQSGASPAPGAGAGSGSPDSSR
jgi:putative membrane protein